MGIKTTGEATKKIAEEVRLLNLLSSITILLNLSDDNFIRTN